MNKLKTEIVRIFFIFLLVGIVYGTRDITEFYIKSLGISGTHYIVVKETRGIFPPIQGNLYHVFGRYESKLLIKMDGIEIDPFR